MIIETLDLTKFNTIYCECCKDVKEFVLDLLPADDLNTHDGLDIVCKECDFIITTFKANDGIDNDS